MSEWFPLHVHSHYSLLDGLSKADQIAKRVTDMNFAGSALTDHGTIAGSVSFLKAMKKAKKKAILGCEFYLSQLDATIHDNSNASHSHLCVLARNLEGWRGLIQATSESNRPALRYRKPRLDLNRLAAFAKGNFIAFSGHMGSDLANVIFLEPRVAYSAKSVDEAKALARPEWWKHAINLAGKYQELFGKGNFYIEIQVIDHKALPAAAVVAEGLRYVANRAGIPCVATADSHYSSPEDSADQRILLCSALETTLNEVRARMAREEDVSLGAFFRSMKYHIPSLQEMEEIHTPEELSNSVAIADMVEEYDILGKPMLPQFACPDGLTPDQLVQKICDKGWSERIGGHIPESQHATYKAQLKHELGVIFDADLSSYFLIVQDYCNWTREQRWKVGKGRGSGAGCLASYLMGITNVDPIPYGLMFERFYNAGRNAPGRVSLPDIDCDFPISKREQVIAYIRQKYGTERVCQMVTFSRMQGRGAITDVFRAHERMSYEEMKKVTEHIPDEAEISDQLQEMREETGEASIIRWALENNGPQLKQWCELKEDGTLDGPLARDFAQAIRLEGTKRSQGKHAAGLIISSQELASVCPMVYDKSTGQMVAGLEMNDLEAMGHVKFDILGVAALDKVMGATSIVKTGRISA